MGVFGRFKVNGAAVHGAVDGDRIHIVEDVYGACRRTGETVALEGTRILPPVRPQKVFAIGLNYADHAKESGKEVPPVPLMWFKAPSAIIAHQESVVVAYPEHQTDYEVELTVVIGKRCKGVKEAEAANYIFGYTIGQDISDRTVQFSETQWARAKSFDTYAPMGPFIYTGIDASNLPIETRLNGEVKQQSNTNQLVFSAHKLVAFLSEAMTLEPGDCIMTGTPFGVGPIKDGDVIESRIGDMAPLINPVTKKIV